MGIFDKTPSIRLDTEAFNKGLKELNLTNTQFNRKLTKLGVSLGDPSSKTNYLNKLLRDAGKPELQYKNVISKNRPRLTTKGTLEVGMGGVEPGKKGAPNNAKIWNDGTKIQKAAEKKFKNVTDQRKYFVDTMKKLYKNVPKKQILDLFKNVIKGIKSVSPIGIMSELAMDMIEKNPELMNILPTNQNAQPMTFNKGGMMNIDYMTRPLGMQEGGDPIQERMAMLRESMRDDENQSMRAPDITSVALQIAKQQGDSSEDNINLIINQLQALMPSLEKTMQKELTPMSTQGLKYLFDKMNVMTGKSSDPQLNRSVGFGRVE